jgi:hypothetical protein
VRIKKPFRKDIDYDAIFREPINKLHRKFDGKHGADTVAACCNFAIKVLRDPFTYTSPACAGRSGHEEFATWYWMHPDLFLETMKTIRHHWFNATDTFKVQIFLTLHSFITTPKGEFLYTENATDKDISSALDNYWEKKISLSTVKKARQLLSVNPMQKGKRKGQKSL